MSKTDEINREIELIEVRIDEIQSMINENDRINGLCQYLTGRYLDRLKLDKVCELKNKRCELNKLIK